jgi:hypothetical protein
LRFKSANKNATKTAAGSQILASTLILCHCQRKGGATPTEQNDFPPSRKERYMQKIAKNQLYFGEK